MRIEHAKPKVPAVSYEKTLCPTSMCASVLFFAIPFQRKGKPSCFEQDFCDPSHIKKRRPKKQRLRVLQFLIEESIAKHYVSMSISFFISTWKIFFFLVVYLSHLSNFMFFDWSWCHTATKLESILISTTFCDIVLYQ